MISYSHACIFIHITKTGGTSIEDVIWPNRQLRSEKNLWMGFVRPGYNRIQSGGLQHLLARQVRHELGAETFDGFFSFAFVRNPWDRTVSQYAYMRYRPDLRQLIGMPEDASLDTYLGLIEQTEHVQWFDQSRFVTDAEGKIMVDFIGRFERLQADMNQVLERIGLPIQTLPHKERSQRSHYRDYYTAATRQRVASWYAEDIERFQYRFDD